MDRRIGIRIDELLGRELLGGNHQPIGRIEEFRAEPGADGLVVRDVVIGALGLLERMNLGARLVVGAKPTGGRVVRWEQIDFTNPSKPRLVVDIAALDKV